MSNGTPQPAKPEARVKAPGASAPGGAYPVDSEIHVLDRIAVVYRYRAIAIIVLTTLAVIIKLDDGSDVRARASWRDER